MTGRIQGFRAKGVRKPFWALLRMQFKVQFNAAKVAESLGLDDNKRRQVYLYLGLMALAFVPFTVMVFKYANMLSQVLVQANQPGLAVILAVMAGQLVVVFFGLSHLMSSLYYSSDLEQLQSLPLTPRQIMYGKVGVIYAGQLAIMLFVAGPFLITLGIHLSSALYWPLALVIFLLIPAVPLGIGLLLVVPLMILTAGTRRRDMFRVLFGLLFVAVIFAFQYLNTNMIRYGPDTLMARLMEKDGLVSVAAGYYPVLKWAAWALTGTDFVRRASGLALYSGISLGLLNLVIGLTQGWFLGGVTTDNGASAKKPVSEVRAIFARQRGTIGALLLREHRIIARTPNFLLTVLLNLLILPILMVSMYFTGGEELAPFLEMILGAQAKDVVVLAMVGFHGVVTGLNQVASTAVSREGPMFWMSKIIPVSPKVQMRAKLIYSLLFAFVQLVILAGVGIWFFKLGALRFVVLMALGILVSVPVSIICLLNDLHRPKLNWTEPQQAMKGNFQTMVAWLLSMLYLAAVAFVVRGFYLLGLSAGWLYGISATLLAISSYGLLTWLDHASESVYVKL